MSTILVTDGEQRASLAVVRSLGRDGHRVIVASQRPGSLAGSSRYAHDVVVTPDPLKEADAFAAVLADHARGKGASVLLPITDASLMAVLTHRDRFEGIAIPFAGLEQVRQINDKARLMEIAPQLGIAVPRQVSLKLPGDRGALPTAQLQFPLVLKPSRSVVPLSNGSLLKLGVLHAANPAELERSLDRIPGEGYPILLQQRVVGPGIGIFLLLWNGETIAVFSHRRIREKPPSGGVSVYRESIAADPDLVRRSRSLLESCGWQGVAMIEYKLDAATETPYLMEINGRFWGSLQLAIDAGVDFPTMLVDLALGRPVQPVFEYRTGIRSRWLWGDMDHLLARIRKSDAQLSLPPGSPGRLATLAQCAVPWRPGDRYEVLRWTDPRPFIWETLQWFRGR